MRTKGAPLALPDKRLKLPLQSCDNCRDWQPGQPTYKGFCPTHKKRTGPDGWCTKWS